MCIRDSGKPAGWRQAERLGTALDIGTYTAVQLWRMLRQVRPLGLVQTYDFAHGIDGPICANQATET